MVDRENRNVGASVLRDLIDGKITNGEFMKRFKFPKNTDKLEQPKRPVSPYID